MITQAARGLIAVAIGLLTLDPAPSVGNSESTPLSSWVSTIHRDHPLAGTIWSVREGRKLTGDELVEQLKPNEVVLLGEVHDNPDHHRLRAWLIGRLAREREGTAGSKAPAVVFEHIRADQQPIVTAFLASQDRGTAARLLERLDWSRSGWPAAEMFQPLFDVVLRHELPILAGNAPGNQVRQVAKQGLTAIPGDERVRLKLEQQLEQPLKEALIKEIEENHCGLLPHSAFAPMALAQQYRDAHLADVLLIAQRQHGAAVLIAGNGHVRVDRAVPWHLRQRAPELVTAVVSFVEVEAGREEPTDQIPRDPDGQPAVDYAWFTPKAEREDPCEQMRRQMKGMNGGSPKHLSAQ